MLTLLLFLCWSGLANPADGQDGQIVEVEVVGSVASQDSGEVEVVGSVELSGTDGAAQGSGEVEIVGLIEQSEASEFGQVEVVATVETADFIDTGQVEIYGKIESSNNPVPVEVIGRILPATVLTYGSWGEVKKRYIERQ